MQCEGSPSRPARPASWTYCSREPGRLVVEDVADVGLVDAHAEGAGGHHHQSLARLHVALLRQGALLALHLPVVAGGGDARLVEREPDVVHLHGGGAVDDARALEALEEPPGGLGLEVAGDELHAEAQVVPVGRRGDHLGVDEAQAAGDVVPHLGRGGGGERQDRGLAEEPVLGTQAQVGGAEVVAPLGDAVGLVDAQERRVRLGEVGPRGLGLEGLGGGQDDEAPAGGEAIEVLPPLGGAGRVLSRRITGTPRRLRLCSWSAMRAMRGETTMVGRSTIIAGTW